MAKTTIMALLATLAIMVACAAATHPGHRVYLQKEVKMVPQQWMALPESALQHSKVFNVIFALKNQNTEKLLNVFEEVTNPEHPKYGQYWSIEEITALVQPDDAVLKTVTQFLASYGLTEVSLGGHRDLLFVDIPLEKAAQIFNVEFKTYIHRQNGKVHTTSVQPHSLPAHVAEVLDYVVGFNGFPTEARKRTAASPKPMLNGYQVGPLDLRAHYNITQIVSAHPNNKQAVAEFQGEYYWQSDLQSFIKQYYPHNSDPTWWTATVKGTNDPTNPSTEGSLDIEYIMGVAPGNFKTEYWSMANFDFYSDLTRWIANIQADAAAPWVHSVSYGSQGNYPTSSYQDRFDTDMQKIGLRGISIIFASGDSGTGCFLCENFDPSFPATSAFVTSVGATSFWENPVLPGFSGVEGAVTQFSSGGGMSWYKPAPSYQKAAVDQYFRVAQNLPGTSFYNRNGRGTPDVAALGIGYTVIQGGQSESVGGTSASAPTFSAIITLLNNYRLNAGKPTLGFLNPWIYQTAAKVPNAFFDVTQGNNQYSCCWTGFSCAPGWDPVTGVGTPNYEVLRQNLP